MSVSQATLRTEAKAIAQDAGPGSTATGVQLLLTDPGDYDFAIGQALALFQQDKPNRRVFDYTVLVAAFLFPLNGTGAILAAPNAWVDGFSVLETLWWPFNAADMADEPNDANAWRTRVRPDGVIPQTVLELLSGQAGVSDVIRLVFTAPHVLHATDPAQSTIRPGDVRALAVLSASFILQMTANKWLQNTGNTGLPNDVVDRRTQSDVARSRAKELRDFYNVLVGKGAAADIAPASGFKDLDIEPSHGAFGYQWHPSWRR